MNGFSGYNQIQMAPEDKEIILFSMSWGTFFYKAIPFGLKKAGATYQNMMIVLFHDMMNKWTDIYIDNMIADFEIEADHKFE